MPPVWRDVEHFAWLQRDLVGLQRCAVRENCDLGVPLERRRRSEATTLEVLELLAELGLNDQRCISTHLVCEGDLAHLAGGVDAGVAVHEPSVGGGEQFDLLLSIELDEDIVAV